MKQPSFYPRILYAVATIFLSTSAIYARTGLMASPGDVLDASKWNQLVTLAQTAHDWGDHHTAGYITGETDPSVKTFAKSSLPTCSAGQVLKGDGTSLSCVTDATGAGGDNLWSHTATQNLVLGGNYLSGDGDSEGLKVSSTGQASVTTTAADATFIAKSGAANEQLTMGWSTSGYSYLQGGTWGGTTKNLILQWGGGNIGLGTTSPWTAKLNIVGSTADNSAYGLYVQNSTPSPVLVARNDGNVGIGTANPSTTLDVNGALRVRNGVVSKAGLATSTDLGLYSEGATNWLRLVANSGQIRFYVDGATGNSYSGGTPAMMVDSNGNVGIGTTSPGQKLSVAWVIESTSGGIKFPDGSIQVTSAQTGEIKSVSNESNNISLNNVTSWQDSGLSFTVSTNGQQSVLLLSNITFYSNVSTRGLSVRFVRDTTPMGHICQMIGTLVTPPDEVTSSCQDVDLIPPAGTHTYKLQWSGSAWVNVTVFGRIFTWLVQ